MTWLWIALGLDDPGSPWYLFWSGLGSDIGEIAILFGIYSWYRKAQCHVTGCRKLGLHHVEGTPFVTCRHHHPDETLTVEQVHAAHRKAKA
jgi:hypothetical protein